MTDLDGATHRGPDNAYPANAGEFAARWNAKTEEERNGWVAFMVDEAIEAQRADRNAIEWAARVQAAESRIAELEAVIQRVCEARQWHPQANRWFYPPNDIDAALSAAPSTVLDQMIREAKADGWDEGVRAENDYFGRREDADAAGQGVMVYRRKNPYRNGDA